MRRSSFILAMGLLASASCMLDAEEEECGSGPATVPTLEAGNYVETETASKYLTIDSAGNATFRWRNDAGLLVVARYRRVD